MKKLLFLLLPFFANAEVIHQSPQGFTITIEKTVNVSAEKAYQQFLKVDQWWNSEHTWFGDAKNLYIEPKVNGCFCEVDGDKQALHMTVSYINPNKEVRMIGGLGPLQMMGIHGGMSWQFIELSPNKTQIKHQYQVVGVIQGGLDKLAPIVDKVQTIQVTGLVNALSQSASK